MRLFAVFVGFWMWMLPQMLSTRAMATPDEFGSRPIPVNEEEETKHINIFELAIMGHEPGGMHDRVDSFSHGEETIVIAPHGEVPHPPPWSLA
jgi:hypothetical protein